jgi:hypothetical protein
VVVSFKLLDISLSNFEVKIVSDPRKPRRKTFGSSWIKRREMHNSAEYDKAFENSVKNKVD